MSEANTTEGVVRIEDIIDSDDFEEANKADIEELEPLKLEDDISIINDESEDVNIGAIIETSETKETAIYVATASEINNETINVDDDDDEFEDETLAERLWGLTEMFPESLRNATWTISTSSVSGIKGFYQFSRSAMWVIATSAIILAAPALIENEKSQLDELNRQQQRQILLGPSAMQGTAGLSPTLTPQPSR